MQQAGFVANLGVAFMDEFGVEIGCEHHMFVNMHKREIEKQICLK